MVRDLPGAVFVRGNADRAVLELADGSRDAESTRTEWMVERHPPDVLAFLSTFAPRLLRLAGATPSDHGRSRPTRHPIGGRRFEGRLRRHGPPSSSVVVPVDADGRSAGARVAPGWPHDHSPTQ
jgi:hypothetical protein